MDTSTESATAPNPTNNEVRDVKDDDITDREVTNESASNATPAIGSVFHVDVFHVDTSLIENVPVGQQDSELRDLGLRVYSQETFEQGVLAQVDEAWVKREKKRHSEVLGRELKSIESDIRVVSKEVKHFDNLLKENLLHDRIEGTKNQRMSMNSQRESKVKQLKKLLTRQKTLLRQLGHVTESPLVTAEGLESSQSLSDDERLALKNVFEQRAVTKETKQDTLVQTGHMTPFGAAGHVTRVTEFSEKERHHREPPTTSTEKAGSEHTECDVGCDVAESSQRWSPIGLGHRRSKSGQNDCTKSSSAMSRTLSSDELGAQSEGDSDYLPDDADWLDSFHGDGDRQIEPDSGRNVKIGKRINMKKIRVTSASKIKEFKLSDETDSGEEAPQKKKRFVNRSHDDGSEKKYKKRLRKYRKELAGEKYARLQEGDEFADPGNSSLSDEEVNGDFRVPRQIWNKLFEYQKTGVRWLWELHCQQAGGIVGDEMGLGKTIQTIAFLAGLHRSGLKASGSRWTGLGPVVIVCPTTVLHQWVSEFHSWYPPLRVAILHSSGSYNSSQNSLVTSIVRHRGVLVTSYGSLLNYQDDVLRHEWHLVILDEGHKIRNPNAKITIACKQFRTPHRLILSGSPMQNNLKELWSLFDFVFPGKLGTLPDFMEHFSVPIVHGGYSNATQIQVQTAYKCACVLRDTINPYLLRRMKADVKMSLQLPGKCEQVLFCRLTENQKDVYKEYLSSRECQEILAGTFMVFPGLITLRKICNHPDLATGGPRVYVGQTATNDESQEFGHYKRSGKMIVTKTLLKLWKKQGHRVLLFSQGRQMMDILESFVRQKGYSYQRMDGTTPISARQPMINQFNENDDIYVFLLTTRVGGLGINLTGANRVLIYDPDWNPSTDIQARERAWRIGQRKNVTIYRLLMTGTIEEKIYHRQIFKQFLANRVLKDPKQRRFFKSNDLYELFMLGEEDNKVGTETSAIFAGTGSEVKEKSVRSRVKSNRFDKLRAERERDKLAQKLKKSTQNKLERMKQMARNLSKKIGSMNYKDAVGSSSGFGDVRPDPETIVPDAEIRSQKDVELTESASSRKVGALSVVNPPEPVYSSLFHSDRRSPQQPRDAARTKKKRRKGNKKKLKDKDIVFEGEKVAHLTRQDVFRPPQSESEEDTIQDDIVLKSLFKKTGIQSVMKHDTIMMSSHPDYALVEGEAERVAREAARALKRSRSRCLPATSGVPTWTGQQGQSGAPFGCRPRFGNKNKRLQMPKVEQQVKQAPSEVSHFDGLTTKESGDNQRTMSSSQLLAKIKQRRQLVTTSTNRDRDEIDDVTSDCQEAELITDIRNFVAFQCDVDGQATTNELLGEFKERLPKEDSAKFKAMLKQICDFDKINRMGIWRLKVEFR